MRSLLFQRVIVSGFELNEPSSKNHRAIASNATVGSEVYYREKVSHEQTVARALA